jgi:2-polyprenyl-6-methoxyphenol hydroxylase-like FAD-dependent oxidoreductase
LHYDVLGRPFATVKILISGAGIAGPTLAYWLAHYGFTPTIVESASQLRTGGYVIDFWGAGFDIADRMDLVPEIKRLGYDVQEVRIVNSQGKRVAGFPASAFVRVAQGRYVSIARGDLAAAIHEKIAGRVETIFGDSIASIEQSPEKVHVGFRSGAERDFDLVIGADGLHSKVREIVFGSESRFEKYLGYQVAAFEVDGYRPRDELAYLMYTELNQQVGRFALRGDRTLFLFIFADKQPGGSEIPRDLAAQKAILRARFGKSGWECPNILDTLDGVNELYFDRVSQIRMKPEEGLWSKGRVTLVGDAASCVSFLAGQGSSLAMIAAYILAGELRRAGGDHAQAFARYQSLFGPFVLGKQKAALGFAGAFAPKSKFALFVRNQIFNLLKVHLVADWVASRGLTDKIALPDYR